VKIFTCMLALLLAASAALVQPPQGVILRLAAGKSLSSRGTWPRRGGGSMATAPRRILVVDDDVTVQEVLTFFLGAAYEVTPATSGADALSKLSRERVDLVMLDHRLPDCTGLEILSKLRSIHPNLPVVMLTGYGSEWICAAAFKRGVSDYLQKPVNAVDLVGTVVRILSSGLDGNEPSRESQTLRDWPAPLCIPVKRAMELIQQRYWDQFSLSSLALQVGMSKYHLSRRFREVLGVTFRDYLLRVRLERAKALLTTGRVSITEVAQNVGFGDLPRFDKVFKRYTGFTPSAYRSLAISQSNK